MKTIHGLLLCIILGFSTLFAAPEIGDTSPQERAALMRFYHATNGQNWKDNTRWGVGDPCNNKWKGITCSNTGILGNFNPLVSSIASIELPNNNLTGYIPNDITNSLVKLQVLDLANNKIGGSVPQNILMLQDFRFLSLDNNQFTGTLPTTPIYTAFGGKSKLEVYSVSNNRLSGSMTSDYFQGLGNLTWLALDGNNLSGEFPSSASGLTKLKTFKLSGKNFTGQLPNFNTFPYLTSLFLYKLDLPDNVNFVQNLTNLEYLVLDDNLLTGNLSWIGNLKRLKLFSVSRNNISGTIPSNISTLTNLEELWLDNNNFTGNIPSSIRNLTKLKTLALYNNNSLYTNDSLTVDFINSKTDGAEHSGITNYTHIATSNNSLSQEVRGDFEALSDLYNSTKLYAWRKKTNWLNGLPCTNNWYGVKCKNNRVVELSLSANNLNGHLPQSIKKLSALEKLDFSHNNLWISHDSALFDMIHLKRLDLEHIYLGGDKIMSSATKLRNLVYLNLSGNESMEGSIPPSIGNLTKLTELHLGKYYYVGGNIPSEIGNLTNLRELDLSFSEYTGTIPSSFRNLTKLWTLKLERNNLVGPIPDIFHNLQLDDINLSHNKLSGKIPKSLSKLMGKDGYFQPQFTGVDFTHNCNITTDDEDIKSDLNYMNGYDFDPPYKAYEQIVNTNTHDCPVYVEKKKDMSAIYYLLLN